MPRLRGCLTVAAALGALGVVGLILAPTPPPSDGDASSAVRLSPAPTSPEAARAALDTASPGLPRFLETRGTTATLDYGTGEMTLRTTVVAPRGERPARAWVWAFFLAPIEGLDASRSNAPEETPLAWGEADTAVVEVRAPFHWATNELAARTRHVFARVLVSPLSASAVQQRTAERDRDTMTMTRVRVRGL